MITVHYLKIGRPLFTVWLLEELGLDYELNMFFRDPKTMRAPAELREIHPLGKSPVIEDGNLKLAETGAIASYLIDTYDKGGNLAPKRSNVTEWARFTQWLHYAEGSAFTPLLMTLLIKRAGQPSPPLIEQFAQKEVELHLGYISGFLGDKPWLLGDSLSGADIGVGYMVSMARRLGLLDRHPSLSAYLKRIGERPAFIRAVERTGEEIEF